MKKFFIAAVSVVLFSSCASYHIRQGNRLYDQMAYSMAIEEYLKGLGKADDSQARVRLAESYLRMNDYIRAEETYAKVVQSPTVTSKDKMAYAKLLMRSGKYAQAKTYFDQCSVVNPNDAQTKKLSMSCDSISRWMEDSLAYSVQSSTLNSGQSNFSPVYYNNGVVFTSDRNSKAKTYAWTGRPFLEMYYAKGTVEKGFSSPIALSGEVNGMYHDGNAVFSPKGDTIYFTRNNYTKRKINKSESELVNLKICQAVKKDTSWKNITDLPFNSTEYSTGHPALSSDGNRLYFVSDMPGGFGGTDVYMSEKTNGVWGKPVNLGATVNTPFNEMFPVIYQDSILYFSSEGHFTFGGLDLFRSTQTSAGWSEAKNMGYPLNSSYDDFSLAMNGEGTGGLFSSNRNKNNTMQDNIYAYTVNDLRFNLDGIAVEKQSQQPIGGVMAELTNVKTGKREKITTESDGTFRFKLDPTTQYSVVGSKDTYFTNTEEVSTIGKRQSEDMHVKLKLEMEKIVVNKPIVLENIYYDLDKYEIRSDAREGLNALVKIMQENPGIRVELSSHTDSRAEDKYNDVLSQRRAESAVNYIISRGITKGRITAKGYGEHQLVNNCGNGVKCPEEQHQQNRRTEFKVTAIDK